MLYYYYFLHGAESSRGRVHESAKAERVNSHFIFDFLIYLIYWDQKKKLKIDLVR